MASKIFTGDMPELLEAILNNFNYDFDSLYSCALVNRHWCKIAIPILWQDPFSINQSKRESRSSPLFISQYFSSLDEDEKLSLKECRINAKFSKTLFDYARFLKVLDLNSLDSEVKRWYNLELGDDSQNSDLDYDSSDYELDYDSQNTELDHDSQNLELDYDSQNSDQDYNSLSSEPNYDVPINRIINLLLKLFIESGAVLHKLVLKFSHFFRIKSEIFRSLKENNQFFSRLQDLYLRTLPNRTIIKFVTPLLKILAKNAMNISTLEIGGFWNGYQPQLFNTLIRIIKSQEQLRRFRLSCFEFPTKFYGTISALECQNNTLQEFIIEGSHCSDELEVLKNCRNLEILRVRHCKNEELMKKLNYKVSTLEIDNCSIDASTIVKILEESGILLQRLLLKRLRFILADIDIWEETLLGALKSFCPNITYLNLANFGLSTQLIEIIGNLQKLQFLTLRNITNVPEKERFKQFAEILPLTLQYLNLDNNTWPPLYIDILFDNCNAPLKSLLVNNLIREKNTKALIEFCKRSGTLDCLNIWSLNKDFKDDVEAVEAYVKFVPFESIVVYC